MYVHQAAEPSQMGILALMIQAGYESSKAFRRGAGHMGEPRPGRKDYDQV